MDEREVVKLADDDEGEEEEIMVVAVVVVVTAEQGREVEMRLW